MVCLRGRLEQGILLAEAEHWKGLLSVTQEDDSKKEEESRKGAYCCYDMIPLCHDMHGWMTLYLGWSGGSGSGRLTIITNDNYEVRWALI